MGKTSTRDILFRTIGVSLGLGALLLGGCAAPGSGDGAGASGSVATSAQAAGPVPASCDLGEGGAASASAGAAGGERDISATPEIGTGYRSGMQSVRAEKFAVATANPLATQAACEVLAKGGTAADAVVVAQIVLGLVEPQSSGLGGGGYILYYDKEQDRTFAIDGREVAPLAADEDYLRHVSEEEKTEPLPDARSSGRSIGVPGIVAALRELHERSGKQDWATLMEPGVKLAEEGFEISPRMAASVADAEADLAASPAAAEYFLEDGKAKPAGTLLRNPDYAATLKAIAEGGPDAFYTGEIAADIVAEATREGEGLTPSKLTTADLAGYTV